MKMLSQRFAFCASVLALISVPASSIWAEEGSNSGIEEVVVTAQFKAQSAQDTPLAVTAISADMMEARNQTTIDEIARQTPSVSLQPGAALFGPSIQSYIRGIGQFDFNPAFEPGVGMYIDEVYYPTLTGAQFDLLDLERVEVLRGPQGTLTGRNSIGGAIKLYTRKPGAEPEGYVDFTAGQRDLLSIRGGASLPLTENLSMRLAAVHKEQDGYVNIVDYGCANPGNPEGIGARAATGNCVTGELGEENYTAYRAQLYYEVENFSVNLAYDATHIDQGGPASILFATSNENFRCGSTCTYADFTKPAEGLKFDFATPADATEQSPKQTFDGWGWGLNIDWDVSDNVQIQWISAIREYDSEFGTDDDWTPQTNGAGGSNILEHEFMSHELRVNTQINESLFLTVGGYYSDQETTYWSQQDIRYIVPGIALQFIQEDPVEADSWAAFASLIYDITDQLTMTAGIRYTEETKDYQYIRQNYARTAPHVFLGALDGLVSSYEGDEIDYRLSFDYRFNDDMMVYFTYATGFKGGGVSPRPFDAAQALNGAFGPETLDSYEVGAKLDLLDRTLRLNASIYYYDYSDRQQPLGDCSALGSLAPCAAWQNAGDGEANGFELEVAWAPVENLNIDASYSYYDYEWKSIAPALAANVSLDDPPIWVPENTWSLGVQYWWNLPGGGTITPRIDAAYTDERFMSRATANPFFTDDFVLVNARVAWTNAEEDLTISLAAKNLTDEEYELYIFEAVQAFSGTSILQIGEPREISLSIKKRF